MARTSSIILTPAERKAQVANLKDQVRIAGTQIKAIINDQKALVKARAAADKAFEAQRKADCKERDADDKFVAKLLVTREKEKATLEAQLSALLNDPSFMPVKNVKTAVTTDVDVEGAIKTKRFRRTKAEMEALRAGAAA